VFIDDAAMFVGRECGGAMIVELVGFVSLMCSMDDIEDATLIVY
jgi:hypothetical protein